MAVSLQEARELVLSKCLPLASESVGLLELVGRVAAEEVKAPCNLPRWDNSEMDGFAVRAADCRAGGQLRVTAYLPAGKSAENIRVISGCAVRIMTGAPIPAGCDAIVPIENVDDVNGVITLKTAVAVEDYIRASGSDIAYGEVKIQVGTVLRAAEINLLAAFNRLDMHVVRCPKVAILSTGDELVPPGEIPGAGQIVDSNAYSLAAAVREIGAVPQLLGIARDNFESILDKVIQGLQADILITTAGASAGDRDFVYETLNKSGVEQLFQRVVMKPGGPSGFGIKDGTAVFSLPGNPVSSMIAFEELVRPALLKMMGHRNLLRPLQKAKVKGILRNNSGKTRFLRVRAQDTDNGLVVESAGNQNTGVLNTMLRANALVVLPAERREVGAGESVDLHFF
ncbi:MAG: molybdopterin molybdotransferase MoeA [Desulfuromonas sp.]|nr:molybdopterin molybdotransferase MoeA [Desulfuromonas sp.]